MQYIQSLKFCLIVLFRLSGSGQVNDFKGKLTLIDKTVVKLSEYAKYTLNISFENLTID